VGTLHFLGERPPVQYVVKVSHHFNGVVEVVVEGVGDSPDDRRKIAAALLEAAALVEQGNTER
jgi:hypothetical protein